MASNGISTLLTKQLKQNAKLDLAADDRLSDGNTRFTYDLNLLPAVYVDNTSVPNDHPAGLLPGRPWTT